MVVQRSTGGWRRLALNGNPSLFHMPETPDAFSEAADILDAETLAIHRLNDQLRTTFLSGRLVINQGVRALADETIARVFKTVRDFDAFTDDKDPYGNHEFAMLDMDGERLMFKIDAYDQNLEYSSPNPADASVTTRVLTILLASEY